MLILVFRPLCKCVHVLVADKQHIARTVAPPIAAMGNDLADLGVVGAQLLVYGSEICRYRASRMVARQLRVVRAIAVALIGFDVAVLVEELHIAVAPHSAVDSVFENLFLNVGQYRCDLVNVFDSFHCFMVL